MMIRDEYLRRCVDSYDQSLRRFEDLVSRVSPHQATWRPGSKKWSIAECVEHLNVSLKLYEKTMDRAIRRAREEGLTGDGPWTRWTVPGKLLLRALDPAAKKSLPAPPSFKPRSPGKLEFAEVCARFRKHMERLRKLARHADGLDLDKVRIATPLGSLIRMTAAEAFEIQVLHIPRHLGQAERVSETPGFLEG